MAIDVAGHAITVNAVCPGAVDTPMSAGLMAAPDTEWTQMLPQLTGTWNLFDPAAQLDPEEITHAVMWLASGAAQFVTGLALLVDAGFTIK
jgi:NAD(P)-dependent dehydrogenase (short-subunit alcohol dehydrogenase family)